MIKVALKDGSIKEFENAISVMDVAKSISEGLARNVVAASVNGEVVGLDHIIDTDCDLNLFKFEDKEGKEVFRHTSAHILAQAIKRLYPEAKLAIGPSIENGFYYDIDLDHRLVPEDLEKIEAEMKKIAKEDLKIERFELPRNEALELMKEQGEDYKVELISDLPESEIISFYKQGDFTDLCRGPHLPSTKKVKAVKLQSVAGAYWRGDENNKMLQRIYGTSFEKNKDLEEYLHLLEEAKRETTEN
ncbi:threonyl and Alanyl tRNA synthetase second additional domain protein [Clostridioides difficile CD40]|nr:TGS domain-containing protein [Clostridioides difficile]EQE47754.1 threonyl and Alanyl tRNA synthetase second additional domain protein [Clostridioides difficile CD40]